MIDAAAAFEVRRCCARAGIVSRATAERARDITRYDSAEQAIFDDIAAIYADAAMPLPFALISLFYAAMSCRYARCHAALR